MPRYSYSDNNLENGLFGDAKSLHKSLIVQMVDAQSSENCTTGRPRASGQLHGPREQQATEEALVRSDHPPCSWSGNEKAEKLSVADEP